jgi:hypothetical protein
MVNERDIPPAASAEPVPAPAPDAPSNAAVLKADIDSGRTGDKTSALDPGLAPLGTDDEAAGHPPSAFRVALARHAERVQRWGRGLAPTGPAHGPGDGFPAGYVGAIAAIGAAILIGIGVVR